MNEHDKWKFLLKMYRELDDELRTFLLNSDLLKPFEGSIDPDLFGHWDEGLICTGEFLAALADGVAVGCIQSGIDYGKE